MKKLIMILTIAVSVLLVLPGCRKDENYIRFAWWGNTIRDERTIRVIQLFIEQNPGIIIEPEQSGWDGYWSRLNTQAAAGSLPDIMQQDYSFIEQYNNRGLLLDLTPYVEKGIIDISNWPEVGLAPGIIDGRLVALSMGINAWGMGVDPAVLQAAEITIDDTTWTWRDYEEIAMTIFRRTGVQTMPSASQQVFEHVVRQFGVPFFGDRQLGFTDHADAITAIREVLEMQMRLRAAGALFDPEDASIIGRAMEESPLARGRTWNNFHWSNQHVGFVNASGRPLQYIMFPRVSGNTTHYGTYLRPSMFIAILSSSHNTEMAARFVNFILNDPEANKILLAERGIPVPYHIREELADLVDPNIRHTFDFIDRAIPFTSPIDPPDPPRSAEVIDVISSILLQCLLGRITPEAAVNQMIQTANAVLSR